MVVDVSIVIPARNAEMTLGAQLDALVKQCSGIDCEIIVVDNASIDGTARRVSEYADKAPFVRLARCAKIGINPARNAGVKIAEADKLLFVDADDVAMPGWCHEMLRALERFDIVGGSLNYARLNDPFLLNVWDHPGQTTRLPTELGIAYAVGANVGCHRYVWDTVGGFDETYLHASDDNDFSYRAEQQGFALGFAPDAVVAYRLRSRLRPLARQLFGYAQGCAQFYTAILPKQPLADMRRVLVGHLKELAKVWRLRTRLGRWRYIHRAAWFVGALRGLMRYHVMV